MNLGRRLPSHRRTVRLIVALMAMSPLLSTTTEANASESDGVYGRFDGDVELAFGIGPSLGEGGPQLRLQTHALYLCTAGVYAAYADGASQDDLPYRRSVATGIEVRPLFLGRYARNMEQGPAHFDLLLDSFALALGAFWGDASASGWSSEPGLEVSTGWEFPILAAANGPFIGVRGALRFHRRDYLVGSPDVATRGAFVALQLSWHTLVSTGLVEINDPSVERSGRLRSR